MNSSKASFLSSARKTYAKWGSLKSHICMKIRNWIRYIIFQRYFNPKCKQTYRQSIAIVQVVVVIAIASANSSISMSSYSLNYGGIDCCRVKLDGSLLKSFESTKISEFINSNFSWSGSYKLLVILSGFSNCN